LPPKEPIRVILDSSFLFIPGQFNVGIFEELARLLSRRYEPIVLSPTYEELQRIVESGSPKRRRQAALALRLAQKCVQIDVERGCGESHDDVVARVASEKSWCVATNDRALRKKLRNKNVPVVYLRQKSRLALDGVAQGALLPPKNDNASKAF
jgi:rRNA-processing protein FCF1